MPRETGGPAFPRPSSPGDGSYSSPPQAGMSRRDYFAGQALIGLVLLMQPFKVTASQFQTDSSDEIVRTAYEYADKMLAEAAK